MSSDQAPSDRPPVEGQPPGMAGQPVQPYGGPLPPPQQMSVQPSATKVSLRPKPARSLVRMALLVIMNVLLAVGLILVARLAMAFFRPLRAAPIFPPLAALSDPLVLPVKIAAIKTPFGGLFEVTAAATILIILVLEYVLGVVRRNT